MCRLGGCPHRHWNTSVRRMMTAGLRSVWKRKISVWQFKVAEGNLAGLASEVGIHSMDFTLSVRLSLRIGWGEMRRIGRQQLKRPRQIQPLCQDCLPLIKEGSTALPTHATGGGFIIPHVFAQLPSCEIEKTKDFRLPFENKELTRKSKRE